MSKTNQKLRFAKSDGYISDVESEDNKVRQDVANNLALAVDGVNADLQKRFTKDETITEINNAIAIAIGGEPPGFDPTVFALRTEVETGLALAEQTATDTSKAYTDQQVGQVQDNLTQHEQRFDNPHNVTATQVGALPNDSTLTINDETKSLKDNPSFSIQVGGGSRATALSTEDFNIDIQVTEAEIIDLEDGVAYYKNIAFRHITSGGVMFFAPLENILSLRIAVGSSSISNWYDADIVVSGNTMHVTAIVHHNRTFNLDFVIIDNGDGTFSIQNNSPDRPNLIHFSVSTDLEQITIHKKGILFSPKIPIVGLEAFHSFFSINAKLFNSMFAYTAPFLVTKEMSAPVHLYIDYMIEFGLSLLAQIARAYVLSDGTIKISFIGELGQELFWILSDDFDTSKIAINAIAYSSDNGGV